jgi:hydroxypyruvate isomerase
MPRFAANLSLMYVELSFAERFAAAAADGFTAVECLFPYDHSAGQLAGLLRANGLRQVLFNAPPGDFAAGERGMGCLPGREADFRDSVLRALDYAAVLDCPRMHVLAGIAPAGVDIQRLRDTYVTNLAWATGEAARSGRTLLIEPINPRDIPGYFLNRQEVAHAIVQEVGAASLQVQMDLYHLQIVEGDVSMKLRQYLPTGRVGHLQIAGVPQRQEPDIGELNYAHLFEVIDTVSAECGWEGWVGCEYRPRLGGQPGGTSAGLGWLQRARAERPSNE